MALAFVFAMSFTGGAIGVVVGHYVRGALGGFALAVAGILIVFLIFATGYRGMF